MEVIVRMTRIHCARGSMRCMKCKEFAESAAVYTLIELWPEGEYTRPMMELEIDGKMQMCEFDVIKTFLDDNEALAYSRENGIRIMSD